MIRFENNDGKVWIIPTRNMKIGLMLYQPSGLKGRLLKFLLPYIFWIPVIRRFINGSMVDYKLNSEVRRVISNVLKCEDWEFSVFEGTPSMHKKTTIQIFKNDNILAYCKLSNKAIIRDIFLKEFELLADLKTKQIKNVPHPLYLGDLLTGEAIFIQSTEKISSSKVEHQISDKHWSFLDSIHHKLKSHGAFSESDIEKHLNKLKLNISSFKKEDQEIIQRAIGQVELFYKKGPHLFSLYHGDFTPWNTFSNSDDIFVFDFEYSEYKFPPYMDWFHFFMQVNLIERNLYSREIIDSYNQLKPTLIKRISNPDLIFIIYLLYIVSFYNTGGEHIGGNNDRLFIKRIQILNTLSRNYEKHNKHCIHV